MKSNVVPENVELHTVDLQTLSQTSEEVECDENLTRLLQALLPLSRIHFTAYPSDYGITICPNLLRGTDGQWEVYFDARAMTTDTELVEESIQAVLKEKLARIEYHLQVHMGQAFMNTPTTSRLVTLAQKIAKNLGLKPQPIELGGASDTRHFSDKPIEAIDFGPLGYAIHGPNEHVVLESIPRTAGFYTHLVQALHTKPLS